MDLIPTEKFTTTDKECSGRKTLTDSPHYYVLPKLVKAYSAKLMAMQKLRGVCQRTARYSAVNKVCCVMIL